MQYFAKAFSTIRYSTWIDADNFFNIFWLYGRERDKTAGQIVRKRDCPAESGTVGMYAK